MDEARKVIRRLERIAALQSVDAPAGELLGEVRQLLAEGEAWIAAERSGDTNGWSDRGDRGGLRATDPAAAALANCRATLATSQEVVPGTPGLAAL